MVNDSEAVARRLGDLTVIRANQEVRLARLGRSLAEALKKADSAERALLGATHEKGRPAAGQAGLRAAISVLESEAAALREALAAQAAQVAAMESSRAWRLRTQVLRARAWIEAQFRRPASPPPAAPRSAEATSVDATPPPAAIAAPHAVFGASAARAPRPGRKSVAFISHDAHAHGAQIFLLRLLRWFRAHSDLDFEVILAGEGPLAPEFAALARVSSFAPTGTDALPEDDPLIRRLREANVGLIYANTITNGRVMSALAPLGCPVITHVHELGFWIQNRVNPEDLRIVRERTARFIAVSDAVRQVLVSVVGVPADRVAVVHGCVPLDGEPAPRPVELESVRARLGIPRGAAVVMGCGTLDWRKAPDLFVLLARHVRDRALDRAVHFVWVGGSSDGSDRAGLWHDVEKAGLAGIVRFAPHCEDPRPYFAISDVFALTSREDPFPLVVMEAARAGVPTVCFDAAGGAKEFVEADAGFVVPYLDVAAMAERVSDLVADAELQRSTGQRARAKVSERHHLGVMGPALLRQIDELLGDAALAQSRVS